MDKIICWRCLNIFDYIEDRDSLVIIRVKSIGFKWFCTDCAKHREQFIEKKIKAAEVRKVEFKKLCEKYNWTCPCCGLKTKKLTQDHIVPLSKGGIDDISNIQPLCKMCNRTKGNKHRKRYKNKNERN